MEGLEVLASAPSLWGDRVQRGFVGNRLERDILARAYELIAPRRRQRDNQGACDVGVGQQNFAAGEQSAEQGGVS